MTHRPTLKWILLALLGIAVAAAVAIAASSLASRQIGLASEPISAGDALAPTASSKGGPPAPHSGHRSEVEPPTTTTPEPEPETTTPPIETQPPHEGDDSHGGSGGGHGADD